MLSNTAVPIYYGQFRDAVIAGQIPVNEKVSLEMNRIDKLIDDPRFFYDDEAINGWIQFCENELTLTDGSDLHLLDTFKLWAEQLYGWFYFADKSVYVPNKDGNGGHYEKRRVKKRLTKKQYLIIPRGAAKTMYDLCNQAFGLIVDTSSTHGVTTAPTMKQAEEVLSPFRTAIARAKGPVFQFMTEGSLQNTTGSKANRQKLASTKKGIENFLTNSLLEIRPMSIAKLSMLSYSTANRALVIFSLISLLLLFRTVHLYSENSDIKKSDAYKEYIISFVAAAVLSATALLITRSINPGYFSVKLLLGSFIVIFVLASCFLLYVTVDSERENKALSRKSVLTKVLPCIIFFMVFLTGSLVNPVRAGVRAVEQLPELERAYEISKEDRDALWIVEGEKYPITNALLLKGIKTINSTNVYPDIERWSMIDPSAEDIYNRYAHIEIKLISDAEKNQKKNQRFELIEQDCFRVYLTYNDLKKLDVSYIFSSSVIEDERLELLDSIGAYHIYRCK